MTTARGSEDILISVIVPFGDPRGRVDHLDSWTQQTLAPERYEIIAVANPQMSNEAAIRARLRPYDRLISTSDPYPFPMYRLAAEAARGTILFFTEDHCIADPECLEATARFLNDQAYAAATVRWGHINHTPISRMVQLLHDGGFDTKHWNKMRIRGFALRRAVYHELGGIQAQYNEFAEGLLAAQLHSQGQRIGFVTAAGIQHVNDWSFEHVRDGAQKYTRGECAYCTTHDEYFCDRYFSATAAFALVRSRPAEDIERDLRDLSVVFGEALRGRAPGRITAVRLIGEWLHLKTSRPRLWLRRRIKAPLSVLTARIRFALSRFDEATRFRAFKDYWQAVVYSVRADFFSRDKMPAPVRLPLTPDAQGELSLDKLTALHALETHNGTQFRWSPPVATIFLALLSGDYLLEIDTLGLRGPVSRLPVSLLWNGCLLPSRLLRRSHALLSFQIDRAACAPEGPQRLTIVIPAMILHRSPERRRLGLPIASLRVRPMSAADRS